MNLFFSALLYFKSWLGFKIQSFKLLFISPADMRLINIGLRAELALYEEQVISGKIPKPKPTPIYRQTWVYISKHLPEWDKWINAVKPETLVKWHRLKFTEFWAIDFFTVPYITFQVLYVLIIEHGSRRIVHFAVTKNPNMFWLTQQFRNATPYGDHPKYLIHDNDPVFKSKVFQDFLASSNIKSKATSFRSPWQNPYAERVIGTIRAELLNHIIPFSERHLEKLLDGYINEYYNSHRTHQGLDGNTPIPTPEYEATDINEFKIKTTPVLNGLYHKYDRVA